MKTQKRTIVVFLLMFSLILTYLTPLVFAGGGNGNPEHDWQRESPPENQQQGSGNTNKSRQENQGGQQTGGHNQSSPGQPGYSNKNNTTGAEINIDTDIRDDI